MFGHKFARVILASTALAGGCLAAPSWAQTTSLPSVPDELIADDQGFDLLSTSYQKQAESLTIGDADTGLTFERTWTNGAWVHNYNFELSAAPPYASPEYRNFGSILGVIGKNRVNFYWDGTKYLDSSDSGKTVTPSGSGYIIALKDGTKIVFDRDITCGCNAGSSGHQFIASAVIKPSGEHITLYYKVNPGTAPYYFDIGHRISGAVSSNGYELKFEYVNDTPSFSLSSDTDYNRIQSVTGYNLATSYCDPQADHCSTPPTNLPRLSYVYSSPPAQYGDPWYVNVSDAMGRTTTYTLNQYFVSPSYYNRIIGIRRPGDSSNSTSVTYGDSNNPDRVTSITNDGVTYNYNTTDTYTGADQGFLIVSGRTIVRTNPTGASVTYKAANFVANSGRITSVIDPLSHQTDYGYDVAGRLTSVRNPEGDTKTYGYDGRGNLLSVTEAAKPGSGLANIVTSATYPSSCTNALTCNQPLTAVDAKGNTTTFTYDATHGGVLTATLPAASTGGVSPQTRYGYTALQGSYKNSVGAIVASGFPTYKRTSISTCRTLASCTGTADETRTTLAYAGNGTTNNLTLTAQTDAAGDGSLSATTAFTYDDVGNVASIDGPLAGNSDTVTYRYDVDRERVGAISPDPDGAGALKRRAIRTTYNNNGQPTLVEAGTVNGTTDTDWSAFVSLQQQATTYDANARKATDSISGGGTTYSLAQYSYDADGRLDCTAVRMKPSTYGSLPSACTATTGTGDADRITKMTYNNADRVTKTTSAYGTADASDDATTTYTDNGQVATLTDANNNKTTYTYDGFDRLSKISYPSTTKGSGTSSGTDYEQLGYDANSNLTSRLLRGATSTINYTYDNLNRLQTKDLPGTEPDVTYGYDLLGRLTSAATSAQTLSFTYDALGRNLTQTGPLGTVGYQYDIAGRRTRLTWPDLIYVTYDYLVTGEMTTVKENGATTLGTYAYDDLGRRTSLTSSNGVVTSYGYDNASRLTSLVSDLAGTANDLTLGFAYNSASQITSTTRSNNAYSWPGATNVARNYTANGLNQYATAGGATFGYDAKGNLTSDGTTSYTYDSENRMVATTFGGGATLLYDPLGRYYGSIQGSATKTVLYDGDQRIAEYDGATLSKRYVLGAGEDNPLVWYEGSTLSDRRSLQADERGSITSVVNAAGTLLSINSYDEYGIPWSQFGKYGFTGQVWIPQVGCWYYKARFYCPTIGRFMQTDPIGYGDGMNWYNYVGGDPVNNSDPSGTDQNYLDINPGAAAPKDDGGPQIVITGIRSLGVATFGPSPPPAAAGSTLSQAIKGTNLSDILVNGTRSRTDEDPDTNNEESNDHDIVVHGARAGRTLPRTGQRGTPTFLQSFGTATCKSIVDNVGGDPAQILLGIGTGLVGNKIGAIATGYASQVMRSSWTAEEGSIVVAERGALIGARAGRAGGVVGAIGGAIIGVYAGKAIQKYQDKLKKLC